MPLHHPSIHQSIQATIHPSNNHLQHREKGALSIHPLSIIQPSPTIKKKEFHHPSIKLSSIYPSVHPSNHPSIIHLTIHPSIHLSSHHSFDHPSICLSIHPSIHPSDHPAVCLDHYYHPESLGYLRVMQMLSELMTSVSLACVWYV